MVSIREVAKKAGVSPATVSRVINGTANVDPIKKIWYLRQSMKPVSSRMSLLVHFLRSHLKS